MARYISVFPSFCLSGVNVLLTR